MNVPSKKELLDLFDRQQRDHPIGLIAARYVEAALKKHPPDPTKPRRPTTPDNRTAPAPGSGTS
jgi:hypothetical protein